MAATDTADFTAAASASWQALHPDEDLAGFDVAMRVQRLALILTERLNRAVETFGFSMFGDYEVVAAVRRADRPLQPSEIADQLRITRAGITGRLKRLEAAGLIERQSLASDARSVLVRLTPAGVRRVDSAFESVQADRDGILEPLTRREADQLGALLRKVLAPLDQP